MGDFVSRYVKNRPTKYRGHNPVPRNLFNRQKENDSIVNSEVDEIFLHENQNLSAENETHENVESDFYEI